MVVDSVKENVFLRYAEHHTTDLNKDRESLRGVQTQMFSNTVTHVLGTCVGADLKNHLFALIREKDLQVSPDGCTCRRATVDTMVEGWSSSLR